VTLRLGSRGSTLALWQAHHVKQLLQSLHAGLAIDVEVLHTTGDRIADVPLAMIGEKGLFTKEVDAAVLDGRVDCAVHSFKDVPTKLPDGITVAAVLEREDPRDAFLPAPGGPARLLDLPAGTRLGTGSLRRRALLLHLRPDAVVTDLRGNLDTRLEKLRTKQYDGIILALAGVRRVGREAAVGETLEPPDWLPAVGQGALAVVCRDDDDVTRTRLRPLEHPPTRAATVAERAFLALLEGGCQVPIGALGSVHDNELVLHGLVASLAGTAIVRGSASGPVAAAGAIGERLARQLLEGGAAAILRDVRAAAGPTVPAPAAP
jgi:hydroxymethylbilane synthase